MEDHIWILDIASLYKDKRYILWLTPDTTEGGGSIVERGVKQIMTQQKSLATLVEQATINDEKLGGDLETVKSLVEQSCQN